MRCFLELTSLMHISNFKCDKDWTLIESYEPIPELRKRITNANTVFILRVNRLKLLYIFSVNKVLT